MPEDDEQRGFQVGGGILQGAQNRWAEDIASHTNHEEFAETGIENQFRWHPAIAATENRGVGLLSLGQFRKHFLLQGRETCQACYKALVAFLQAVKRLLGRVRWRSSCRHGS